MVNIQVKVINGPTKTNKHINVENKDGCALNLLHALESLSQDTLKDQISDIIGDESLTYGCSLNP
jgi:hypothetical protein